ncbi:hypothetical protein [Caballeronia cordobensis]|nr:hypothetical protein [Caballeronia cordobensis]
MFPHTRHKRHASDGNNLSNIVPEEADRVIPQAKKGVTDLRVERA